MLQSSLRLYMCIWLLRGRGEGAVTFVCLHYFGQGFVCLLFCFLHKADQSQSLEKGVFSVLHGCPWNYGSKKAFGAFGVLTSKVHCLQILWHLNEAVWLQGQRAPFDFLNQDHIWDGERALFLWGTHSSPQVRLYCADMWGGRHGASKEMDSKLALPPIHCGTFTELASLFRSAFLAWKMCYNFYLLLRFSLTVKTKLIWEIALKSIKRYI